MDQSTIIQNVSTPPFDSETAAGQSTQTKADASLDEDQPRSPDSTTAQHHTPPALQQQLTSPDLETTPSPGSTSSTSLNTTQAAFEFFDHVKQHHPEGQSGDLGPHRPAQSTVASVPSFTSEFRFHDGEIQVKVLWTQILLSVHEGFHEIGGYNHNQNQSGWIAASKFFPGICELRGNRVRDWRLKEALILKARARLRVHLRAPLRLLQAKPHELEQQLDKLKLGKAKDRKFRPTIQRLDRLYKEKEALTKEMETFAGRLFAQGMIDISAPAGEESGTITNRDGQRRSADQNDSAQVKDHDM